MVSTVKSPTGISLRSAPYDNFQGLDVSRDVTSLDTGKTNTSPHAITHSAIGVDRLSATPAQILSPGSTRL